MKTMIVTFYGISPEMGPGDLRRLLSDALAELVAARGPSAEEYVERRFPLPSDEYPEGPDRQQLVEDVEAVRRWARHLQDNGFRVTEYSPPDLR